MPTDDRLKQAGVAVRRARRVLGDVCVWYRPHARQAAFHAAGGGEEGGGRERLFLAGNRVGKTLAGAAEMAFHLTGRYPPWWCGRRFEKPVQAWAASVTREATRDILQAAYLGRHGVLGQRDVLVVRHGSGVSGAVNEIVVRHAGGGESVLGFKSFDQGRESFQGTARHVVHLDEEPPLDVYEECLLRTMTVDGMVMLTMTPLMGLTPMVAHFAEDGDNPAKAVVRAGWNDAPHLDMAAKARLRASLRPHEVAAREHGVPQLGRGAVYPVPESSIVCPRFEIPPHWPRCAGVDFGWANPTAAVWLAKDEEKECVYVYDVYAMAEATPAEHARQIGRRGAVACVGDPAGLAASARDGQSLMALYEAAGLRIEPADNAVEAGIMAVLEMLRAGRLKVFDDLLPWWAEFRAYRRDAKGKVLKRRDHLMDATRYAVVSGLPLARPLVRPPLARRPVDWRTV